jgi:hypothetical protein
VLLLRMHGPQGLPRRTVPVWLLSHFHLRGFAFGLVWLAAVTVSRPDVGMSSTLLEACVVLCCCARRVCACGAVGGSCNGCLCGPLWASLLRASKLIKVVVCPPLRTRQRMLLYIVCVRCPVHNKPVVFVLRDHFIQLSAAE